MCDLLVEGEGGRGGVGAVCMLPSVLPVLVWVVVVAQLREGARQLVAAAMQGSRRLAIRIPHCTLTRMPATRKSTKVNLWMVGG